MVLAPPTGADVTLCDVERNEREQALALVQAGEFSVVLVGVAGKGMLRARQSSFLVWTPSKPEARRRAHAYCEARCLQIDRSRNRPAEQWGEALHVDPATHCSEPLARRCVMRGEYEPLPTEPV